MGYITETFTSAVAGTNIIAIGKKPVNLSVIGPTAGDGTVELQRKTNAGTWGVVRTMTTDTEEVIESGQKGQQYRFECTIYVSGSFVCEFGD